MANDDLDPEYRAAVREALVILAIFVAALAYTIAFCYGLDHDVESVRLYWGIPGWVLWGIMAPWTVCVVFTGWFCFRFMKGHDGESPASASSEVERERPDAK
jgi:hypothetical protein